MTQQQLNAPLFRRCRVARALEVVGSRPSAKTVQYLVAFCRYVSYILDSVDILLYNDA